MSGERDLRVGDAERERAAAALGEHFAAGRLDAEEHAERLDAAMTARTHADLDVLFHDLPARTPAVAERPGRAERWRRRPRGPVAVLLLVLVLAVLVQAPWLVFVGLGALWWSRAHRSSCGSARQGSPPPPPPRW